MKKIIAILSLVSMTSTVFAQGNISTEKMKKPDRSQKGIYLGLSYLNLTDMHSNTKTIGEEESSSEYTETGTHLGAAGITLGYNRIPEKGFGFSAGAQLLESINRSENGDEKLNIIIPEANVALAANRYIFAFAGLNAAIWTGSAAMSKIKTQLGGQGGLGVRFNKSIVFNAGYLMMNQKVSTTSYDGKRQFDTDFQMSGFNSTLTYTF